jgi:hypothetical protein
LSADDGLRSLFRKNLSKIHWTSLETGLIQRGVPDLYGCSESQMFWIECKSVKRGWAIKFQPGQVGWLLAHARHGGTAFVAVRRRVDREKIDELFIYEGKYAKELCDSGLRASVPCLLRTHGGPARWLWSAARLALTST